MNSTAEERRETQAVPRVVPSNLVSRIDKKLQRMSRNPNGDWTIEDLKSIAKRYEISCRHDGTSHAIFGHPAHELVVSVPAARPIKPVYIEKFLSLVLAIAKDAK